MKPLQTQFKKGAFDHKLVKREGDICIFWRKAPHHQEAHYEVIVVQHFGERSFPDGRTVPAGEGYPSSEQWGTAGWTYNDLEPAEVRFNKLLNAR